MIWIALVIPFICLVVGVISQRFHHLGWLGSIVVLAGTWITLRVFFTMQFWPWLWLYVFLSWLGSWLVSYIQFLKTERRLRIHN